MFDPIPSLIRTSANPKAFDLLVCPDILEKSFNNILTTLYLSYLSFTLFIHFFKGLTLIQEKK